MKFTKEQALNLLEKWDQKDENFQSTVLQNAHIPELDSVAFDEAIYCYFDYLEVLIQESENNSVDEIFEKLYDEIPDIVDANINIYDDDLEKEAFKKFNYIFENHNEYFENFEPKK
ncbi:MYG1 family protein, partial [Mycoplasmopsis pullorum]|uniref:MYG1 family protein n=3 Tax=Mycoplasmopsis pullorum TaxID=48003 RepID=UPI00111A2AA9